MAEIQAQRTLVKSPPELWAELSDRESLAEHLGEFGEIRITRTQPESTVAWEGERIRGTVSIEASGWGTQVSLTARIDAPEPETPPPAAPPERVEHALEVVGTDVVRIDPPPPEPEPAVAPEPPPAPEPPSRRRRFFARLFPRIPQLEQPAPPEPEPAPEPPAQPPEPYELRVVHAAVACRIPERPPPEPPPGVEPALDADRATAVLADVLDRLGAAHHRPFSRS